jgi:hypothetical protein
MVRQPRSSWRHDCAAAGTMVTSVAAAAAAPRMNVRFINNLLQVVTNGIGGPTLPGSTHEKARFVLSEPQ